MERIAVFAGSFDPFTVAHLAIVKRASAIFDHEIVSKTKIAENIQISGKKNVKANSVNSMLLDSVKFLREFEKCDGRFL